MNGEYMCINQAEEDAKRFGKNVKSLRRFRMMSGEALAKESGVSRTALWAIETGKTRASLVSALSICRVFGVSIEDMSKRKSFRNAFVEDTDG